MKAVKVGGARLEAALDALIAEGDFAGVMELCEATAAEQPFAEGVEGLFRARVAKQWPRGDAGRRVAAIWERVRAKAEAEPAFSRPDLQSGGESEVVEVVPEPKRVQRFNRRIGEAPRIEARKVEGEVEGDGEVAEALQSAIAKLGEERRAEEEAAPKSGTALLVPSNELLVPVAVPPPAIKELNDKHAVIGNLGGKCVVMEWVPSVILPGAKELSYQSFTSFRERYANEYVDLDGPHGRIPKAAYWLTHPQRRQYEGMDLMPNGPAVLPGGYLNLWRGWGVEPRKGSWRLMQRHIAEVLANGNQEFEDYIKRWTAWKFQNPGLPPEVALALLGGKGAGKGAWGYTLMLIFGQHGLQIYASEHLTGKHNAHLQNKLYLFLDEAIWAGDKEADRKLKTLTTEKWFMVEPKGINSFQWVNRLGLYMSGNDKWIVPASHVNAAMPSTGSMKGGSKTKATSRRCLRRSRMAVQQRCSTTFSSTTSTAGIRVSTFPKPRRCLTRKRSG